MPLISKEPETCELPDLLLAGACSFAAFFADNQFCQIGETWQRLFAHQDKIDNTADTGRCFGLELYPPEFMKDKRWYYMACVEVTSLTHPLPSNVVTRFIPASKYAKFTVTGPVTEIAPAFRYIYDEWLPVSDVKIASPYDLELSDERFKGPENEQSQADILLPVA